MVNAASRRQTYDPESSHAPALNLIREQFSTPHFEAKSTTGEFHAPALNLIRKLSHITT
jgi:hypothetical protein